jgi:alkanesulfonate monooxygenase SsuD/methylene tetrahydromethanopterin reductase-like flavin-dependent oxidoreductase (luciferase family)
MTAPKLLLVLTENHTMRPPPDIADLVEFAVIAEQAGIDGVMVSEHIVLGPSSNAAGEPLNPRDYAMPGNQDPATPWPSPIVLLSAIDEYAALGIPFTTRGDLLDEQLEIWSRAWQGNPVTFHGNHYNFTDIWLEPHPWSSTGPKLWFGGSSVHDRLITRLVKHGQGFNPLGHPNPEALTRLEAAMRAAGRDPKDLEYVGGIRGTFADATTLADLDEALTTIPPQQAKGFTTICVKPSQFIDHQAAMPAFCQELITKVSKQAPS